MSSTNDKIAQEGIESNDEEELLSEGTMTMGDHLNELRSVILRIALLIMVASVGAFIYKDFIFDIVFAPSKSDFALYCWINNILDSIGWESAKLLDFDVQLINTELSSQFLTHIKMAIYFGFLFASPYIVYKLFGFIRPALYDHERKYLVIILGVVYVLFTIGVLMNYYIIFPISFRFLGTYQVSAEVVNTINLSSYTSSFLTLSFMMGLVFEIPVLVFILGKIGVIEASTLRYYRKYAFAIIMIVSALITPPDVFSLILMTIPLYLLYECSILVLARTSKRQNNGH